MHFYSILNQVLILFLILVVGYIGRKLKIYDNATIKGLTGIMVNITLPAMLINAVGKEFSKELLVGGIKMAGISTAIYALSLVIALLAPYFLKTNKRDLGVYQFMIMFSNVGFMGLPVIKAIFGQEALFYGAIYNVPFNFIAFTIGVMMLTQGEEREKKFNFKLFLNPAVISVLIGLIFFIFSINLPEAIEGALEIIGNTTTPLSMLIIGGMLANIKMGEIWTNWRIYLISVLRLLILPLGVYVLLKPFADNIYILAVPVMITAMPAASIVSILANQYGGNATLGSQGVFISTLLSVITIPILAMLFV